MSFFNKIYNQVFNKKSNPEYNGKKFLVQEMYSLGEQEQKEYTSWLKKESTIAQVNKIYSGIKHKKAGLSEQNERYSIYQSLQSNGFYVLCENFLDSKNTRFVLEVLKDQLLAMGYYQNHSSRDIFEENDNLKTKISYYLKPKFSNYEIPLEQKFGNIHLECLFINDKPDYIKLLANVYSDRNYKEAESFDDLLAALSYN
ncbi:MAG: hypothetical protein RH860_14730 [Cytophagales bacterium]